MIFKKFVSTEIPNPQDIKDKIFIGGFNDNLIYEELIPSRKVEYIRQLYQIAYNMYCLYDYEKYSKFEILKHNITLNVKFLNTLVNLLTSNDEIQQIIDDGANINTHRVIYYLVSWPFHIDRFRLLINNGFDINKLYESIHNLNLYYTLLYMTIDHIHFELFKYLIDHKVNTEIVFSSENRKYNALEYIKYCKSGRTSEAIKILEQMEEYIKK